MLLEGIFTALVDGRDGQPPGLLQLLDNVVECLELPSPIEVKPLGAERVEAEGMEVKELEEIHARADVALHLPAVLEGERKRRPHNPRARRQNALGGPCRIDPLQERTVERLGGTAPIDVGTCTPPCVRLLPDRPLRKDGGTR